MQVYSVPRLCLAAFTLTLALAAAADPVELVRAAVRSGQTCVTIPRGTYTLDTDGDAYFALTNVHDLTIDFSGSELNARRQRRMFNFRGCTNVTVRNVTIDYPYDLPFTQARITAVGPNGETDLELLDGYPAPRPDNIEWPFQVYDAQTREPVNFMRYQDGFRIEPTGERTYRATGGEDRTGKVGDIAVWTRSDPATRLTSAIQSERCQAMTFEDVTIHATPLGRAFYEFACDNCTYRRCRLIRRDPATDPVRRAFPRLRSGDHDGLTSRGAVRGPQLLDCVFEYHCDDDVNISGMYSVIAECRGRQLKLLMHEWAVDWLDAGDTCQLLTRDGRCPPDVKVLAIDRREPTTPADLEYVASVGLSRDFINGGKFPLTLTVTVDRELDLPRGSVLISNRHSGNGFAIRGCRFGHNRARGLLIKASDGVIENNVIEGTEVWTMQISCEYHWMEGGVSRNLLIRNNRLTAPYGIEISGSLPGRTPLQADAHRDLTVSNNHFATTVAALAVTGCTGFREADNTYDLRGGTGLTLKNVVTAP